MVKFESELKNLLHERVYNLLLENVDCGNISEVDVKLISQLFPDQRIGGNYKRASEKPGFTCDRHALREVLCDWYQYCAYDYKTHEEAMTALLEILRHKQHGKSILQIRNNSVQ